MGLFSQIPVSLNFFSQASPDSMEASAIILEQVKFIIHRKSIYIWENYQQGEGEASPPGACLETLFPGTSLSSHILVLPSGISMETARPKRKIIEINA